MPNATFGGSQRDGVTLRNAATDPRVTCDNDGCTERFPKNQSHSLLWMNIQCCSDQCLAEYQEEKFVTAYATQSESRFSADSSDVTYPYAR